MPRASHGQRSLHINTVLPLLPVDMQLENPWYFHRLYVNFSNCSTICGGLFWPRIKLFWIPLFGFNHFESPKTQQLVSEVGLNANNKSDGGPVPDSSRKIDRQHECQYGRNEIELTGMNANMGEMKSDLTEMKSELTASMNANMTEMKSELKVI
ncbi:hypothetical protein TNCV_1522141 [Trichonephila clavipes]|nr:hypothetical protein TNCV_1522141 [Trichonephila clavipes]